MPSSKGEPDNPELREKVKEEVKALSKGGGAGSWSAWKAGELARRYEAKGGGYKDTGDNKNKAQPGVPEKKTKDDKKEDTKKVEKEDKKAEKKTDDKKDEGESKSDEKKDEGKASGGSKGKGGSKKK